MRKIVAAFAALGLICVTSSPGSGQGTAWSVSPTVGITFHGNYYDDEVVTTFGGSDEIETDVTEIDPGASVRVGGRVGYDFAPGVRFHGGVFGSWPDADVSVGVGEERRVQSDADVRVLEFTGGATVELGDVTASRLPLYLGGDIGLVNHSFDEIQWEDEFIDPSTTAIRFGARAGVEYPLASRVSLRGELGQTFVWGAYGDFEDEIAAVEARDEGLEEADTDFEGNSFSFFSLEAGLSLEL